MFVLLEVRTQNLLRLTYFQNYLDSTFTSFKREFSELSELKKMKLSRESILTIRTSLSSLSKQYDFNDDMLDRLAKISRAADHRDFDTVSELFKA